MSSPLAIGAVSAVLRNLLDNGLIEAGPAVGGTVNVSAVAPDTIDLSSASKCVHSSRGTSVHRPTREMTSAITGSERLR